MFDCSTTTRTTSGRSRCATRSCSTRASAGVRRQHADPKALGEPGIDPELEVIFARGIDPERRRPRWPRGNPRVAVARSGRGIRAGEADRLIEARDRVGGSRTPGHPLLDRAQAVWAILEHEEMHQETLLYMWHQLPYSAKREPPATSHCPMCPCRRQPRQIRVPAGPRR